MDTCVCKTDERDQANKDTSSRSEKIDRAFEALHMCMLGAPLMASGDTQSALEIFDAAIEIDPTLATSWCNKGFVLGAEGRYPEALKAYEMAVELDGEHAAAWNGCGYMLTAVGRHQEALEAFGRAIRFDATLAFAWNGRGNAWSALGRYQEALEAYDSAVDIDARLASPWLGKALILREQPELEQTAGYSARQSFCRAIYLRDTYPQKFPLWIPQLIDFAVSFNMPLLARQLIMNIDEGNDDYILRSVHIANTCESFLNILNVIETDKTMERVDKLLRSGAIHYYFGNPLVAFRCFDAVDSENETSMMGQYYLLLTLKAFFEPFEKELSFAVQQARCVMNNKNVGQAKDQIYYASRIFMLAGDRQEYESCMGNNGEHLLRSPAGADLDPAMVLILGEEGASGSHKVQS